MKYPFRALILFVFFICLQNTSTLFAQTITPSNIGSVKVDDLTDAQVQDLIKQAQAAGMSDAQLRSQAIAKGMTEADADKLQNRINRLKNNSTGTAAYTDNQAGTRQLNYAPQTIDRRTN